MSENANDKPNSTSPDQPTEPTLGRRLFMFKAAAIVTGTAAVTTATLVATTNEAQAQRCTDRDPGDRRGWGRWCRRRYRRARICWRDRDPYNRVRVYC